MVQHGTLEKQSFIRIAKATRKVETDGTNLTRSQSGHRKTDISTGDYNGYFKAIDVSDSINQKIKIVDGFDIESVDCANVSVNKLALSGVLATELTITADAYIYLECEADDDPMTSSTNTIVQYATEQEWETGKEKLLISRVTFADDVITDFTREPVSSRVIIWGVC